VSDEARFAQAYRITLDNLIFQTTLWENRLSMALVANGALVALVGAFREAVAVVWAVAILGVATNGLFFLALRRVRSYIDLQEAELRALEPHLPHVAARTLEEKLRREGVIADRDILDAVDLPEDGRALLIGPLVLPWLPSWRLPIAGSISGGRGLEQAFFVFAAPSWVVLASVLTLVEAT
jgi:hypothetical protein